uniref:NADH-ubiquinone oxidoreductase chain 4L n=1 Tax=Leptynoptera sulfurea TaxID=1950150 RepID=A0A344A2I1_9HEMI|nr:NADH dehydrogenase subunit 4L [Leptynoptera sulfurea]AWU48972.1 NADH dehydrogenase subunit 4L [Leptynoptera sulfurea]
MLFYSILYMFYFGSLVFFFQKKHVLMMLISLEFVSLMMLVLLTTCMYMYMHSLMVIIYFTIIMVCEAIMGLVLLTLYVRMHGSDYFKFSSLFMC